MANNRSRIEVRFSHDDQDAIAVFSFLDEGEHSDCELEAMYFVSDHSPIYPKDVLDLDEIENEAIEQYLNSQG